MSSLPVAAVLELRLRIFSDMSRKATFRCARYTAMGLDCGIVILPILCSCEDVEALRNLIEGGGWAEDVQERKACARHARATQVI